MGFYLNLLQIVVVGSANSVTRFEINKLPNFPQKVAQKEPKQFLF